MTSEDLASLTRFQRFLLDHSGVGFLLFRLYGVNGDVTPLCNRAAAQFATALYAATAIAVGGLSNFGGSLLADSICILAACGLAFVFWRMDCFVHLRGLYYEGKQAVRRAGARLGFGSDDITWFGTLAARMAIGTPQALLIGALAAQGIFSNETDRYLAERVAPLNAPIIAAQTRFIDARISAAADEARQAAQNQRDIERLKDVLYRQEIANTRLAARSSARQQVRNETARQVTSSAVQAYEKKAADAAATSQAAAKRYDELVRHREPDLNEAIRTDPNYIFPARGLLARLDALRNIAEQNSFVAAGIVIVDAIGVGLELWTLILALAQCPTDLAVKLYCDLMKRTSAAARDLVTAIKQPLPDMPFETSRPQTASDRDLHGGASFKPAMGGGYTNGAAPPGSVRRGRGRPRKNGALPQMIEVKGDE